MNTAACSTPLRTRPTLRAPLQWAVIENATGLCVCSLPCWIDVSVEDCHQQVEDEAWHRAVQAQRVNASERLRYSVQLR